MSSPMSLLDADQVTKSVYDATNQALQVNVVAQSAASNTVELLDGVGGTNKAEISAANALKVDGSAVTQPVSGSLTVSGSGNFTVVQPTGTNLHTVVDSGTISATQSGTWNVTNVSGTVSLPTGASTSALQTTGNTSLSTIISDLTNGTQQTQVTNFPATQPISGSVTVTQATGTNLHTVVDSGTINTKATTPTALTVTQAAITVGTTAVRLTVAGTAPASTRVLLAATPDNASTATFYIGSATVTNSGATRGFQIVGGQPFVANNDAGDYYIVSSTAAQTVFLIEQA